MKLWQDLLDNAGYVWNHWGLKTLSIGLIKNVANTVYYLGAQFLAVPKTVDNIVSQPTVRKVFSHLGLVLYDNVMPIVLVGTGHQLIQHYTHSSNAQGSSVAPTSFVFKSALFIMSSGIQVYIFYKKRDMELKQAVIMLEAARHYPSVQDQSFKALCEEEKCTIQRQLGGIARQAMVRAVVNQSLETLGHLPYAGIPAEIIKIQNNGTYILTQILPQCDRHVTQYLGKNPELVWAAGLMNWLLTQSVKCGGAGLLSMPLKLVLSSFGYDERLAHLFGFILSHQLTELGKPALRLLTAYIASNTILPDPKTAPNALYFSPLETINPLLWYSQALSFGADSIAIGLKTTVPKLFPAKKEPIRLNGVVVQIRHVLEHPMLHSRYPWTLLPEQYQSRENFVRCSPVIKDNWELVRDIALVYMRAYEQIRNNFKSAINTAALIPKIPASAAWLFKGLPIQVTTLLIEIIANNQVNILFSDARRLFEGLHTNETVLELPDDFQVTMRLPEKLPPIQEQEDINQLIDPTLLIKSNTSIRSENHSLDMPKITVLTEEDEKKLEEEKQQTLFEKQFIKGTVSSNRVSVFNTILNKEEPKGVQTEQTFTPPVTECIVSSNHAALFNTIFKKNNSNQEMLKANIVLSESQNDPFFMTEEELSRLMNQGSRN